MFSFMGIPKIKATSPGFQTAFGCILAWN